MTTSQVISKLIGAGAGAIVLYDSHRMGKIRSGQHQVDDVMNILPDIYMNAYKQNGTSTVAAGAKQLYLNKVMGSSIPQHIGAVRGYAKGLVTSLKDNVITLALGAGAIASRGPLGKICAAGLLISGARYVIFDVIGVGKKKYLKKI